MRNSLSHLSLLVLMVIFTGCSDPLAYAPAPDYRIKLVKTPSGQVVAVAPECPDWRTEYLGPWQNNPWPQYGCANARNLAAMVDRAEDLEQGRKASPASGEKAATSMRRYSLEKTKSLIDPNAKAPVSSAADTLGPESLGTGGLTK